MICQMMEKIQFVCGGLTGVFRFTRKNILFKLNMEV
ncbi:hypothetical protein [Methylomonas albis]|nr:hypothetical protein [Methylomonas albis]